MVEHCSIVNALQWRIEEYGLTETDRALQLFSFAFDGFVLSFFSPLLAGASVILLTREQSRDSRFIGQTIRYCRITTFICVPPLYAAVLDALPDEAMPIAESLALRAVTLAGDTAATEIIEQSRRKLPGVELINEYGPTENSVVASCLRRMEQEAGITIGKPVANVRLYILNPGGQVQPLGVPGELCIGGAGLARGYLNRPELQAEKFVPSPFIAGELIYRTGDLARWLPDGKIQYLGRIDQQVKIRGYRIELGEIESCLLTQKGIKEAVACVHHSANGDARLCAYVTAEQEVHLAEIRQTLAQHLPAYMVPVFLLQLERLPLTLSGKVDRKLLPEPDWTREAEHAIQPPGTNWKCRWWNCGKMCWA